MSVCLKLETYEQNSFVCDGIALNKERVRIYVQSYKYVGGQCEVSITWRHNKCAKLMLRALSLHQRKN